jgi:hypothetical protein
MASDVNIPGDELKEAQDMLGFVSDNIDIDRNKFDFEATFGHELAKGSSGNFEKKWSDGKVQLKKEVKGIRDAIGNILDSFEKTDQDAASNLDDGGGFGAVQDAVNGVLDKVTNAK